MTTKLGVYADAWGIPRTTLFKYVREDITKRRCVVRAVVDEYATMSTTTTTTTTTTLWKDDAMKEGLGVRRSSGGGGGGGGYTQPPPGRGKQRLITIYGIEQIVMELRRRAKE